MAEIEDMWLTPGPMPNGLQAVDDGLWVIDQADNHLYKLDYEDGSVLADMPTETWKSSGVTEGGGYIWIGSTHNYRIYKLADDGSTVDFYDPPAGERDPSAVGPDTIRPHGMEWVDDKLWVSVKPANRNYLMDPGTMEVLHSIDTPGPSPHGLAWDGEGLWLRRPRDGRGPPPRPGDGRGDGPGLRPGSGAARPDLSRGGAPGLLRDDP